MTTNDRDSGENLPVRSELLLYQTEDGRTRIEVRLQDETVWMTQATMAELYQTSVPNVSTHLKNIYDEGEHSREATVKDYLIVRLEGERQLVRNTYRFSTRARGKSGA